MKQGQQLVVLTPGKNVKRYVFGALNTRTGYVVHGVAPRESSSGQRRRLGRVSKRGNTYLRTLLTHGARAVLNRAKQLARLEHQPLNRLQRWVLTLDARNGHNRAAVALANRLAGIIWAVWHHRRPFQVDWSAPALTC
jgi:hypothetical protein